MEKTQKEVRKPQKQMKKSNNEGMAMDRKLDSICNSCQEPKSRLEHLLDTGDCV